MRPDCRCRDGVRPGARRTGAGASASGLRFPVPARSPTREPTRGSCTCVCRLAGEQKPLAGELTAPWTAACVVASVSVAKHTSLGACGLCSRPKKQYLKKRFEKYRYVSFKLVCCFSYMSKYHHACAAFRGIDVYFHVNCKKCDALFPVRGSRKCLHLARSLLKSTRWREPLLYRLDTIIYIFTKLSMFI